MLLGSTTKQVATKNLKSKAEYLINPGSEQIRYTIKRDGLALVFCETPRMFSALKATRKEREQYAF